MAVRIRNIIATVVARVVVVVLVVVVVVADGIATVLVVVASVGTPFSLSPILVRPRRPTPSRVMAGLLVSMVLGTSTSTTSSAIVGVILLLM